MKRLTLGAIALSLCVTAGCTAPRPRTQTGTVIGCWYEEDTDYYYTEVSVNSTIYVLEDYRSESGKEIEINFDFDGCAISVTETTPIKMAEINCYSY